MALVHINAQPSVVTSDKDLAITEDRISPPCLATLVQCALSLHHFCLFQRCLVTRAAKTTYLGVNGPHPNGRWKLP